MSDEIASVDDLRGMLPTEVLAVVQAQQERIAELESAHSQIIRVLGPAPCRCLGQQEEVAQALEIARTALARAGQQQGGGTA